MATETLNIRVTAELGQIRQAITGLQQQLENANAASGRVGTSAANGIAQLNTRLASTTRMVAGLAASLGAGLSIAGLVRASDEASNIAAKLRLATKDAQQFAVAQKAVFDIAQRTRTSLLASVDLYARIERSTREIGLGQRTILKLTETINQAAQISGGGAGAEAALFQLSQGLASGQLRGEELNSVLEQTPRLAQAIADGMNIPLGKLRQLAQDGKLTSEAVLRAILGQSEAIEKEFAQFPATIAAGFTQIRNAFVQYLQTSEGASKASRDLAEAMATIAENLPAIIDAVIRLGPAVLAVWGAFKLWPAIAASVTIAQAAIARFTAQVALMTPAMRAASAQAAALNAQMVAMGPSSALGATGAVGAVGKVKTAFGVMVAAIVGWQIGTYLSEQFQQVEIAGVALAAQMTRLATAWANAYKGAAALVAVAVKNAYNNMLDLTASALERLAAIQESIPLAGEKMASTTRGLAEAAREAKTETKGLGDAWDAVVAKIRGDDKAIQDSFGEIVDANAEARRRAGSAAGGGGGGEVGIGAGAGAGAATAQTAKLAQIHADLVRDSVTRAIAQLDRLYAEAKISTADYFAEKQRLELEGIDAAIAAAEAERGAAKGADEVAAANANIIKLLRDRKQVAVDTANAQAAAEDELTRQLGALNIRMMAAQGETARATRAQLEEDLRDFKARMLADGKQWGIDLANRVIDSEVWAAQIQEAQRRASEAMGQFNATETATGAQVDAGILSQGDARDRVSDQRQASLEILAKQREELVRVRDAALEADNALTFQQASEAITVLDGQIAQLSIDTSTLAYQASKVLQNSLTTFFTDLASGSKSAGDALKDFVKNFIAGMAQIAAQALATYLVLQMLDAIYPGLGQATAAMMSAGSNHSGGMAGKGGTRRQFPALAFAGAPRYHSGGIAGMGPDEVPAVLKKGEEVLTETDPRHRNNGGIGAARESRVEFRTPVVAIGEEALSDALQSAGAEASIVAVVQRNWEGLSRG